MNLYGFRAAWLTLQKGFGLSQAHTAGDTKNTIKSRHCAPVETLTGKAQVQTSHKFSITLVRTDEENNHNDILKDYQCCTQV